MNKQNVKFIGKEVEINGQKYILPPLGLGAFSKHDAFKKLQTVFKAFLSFKEFFDKAKAAKEKGEDPKTTMFDIFLEADLPQEVFECTAELTFLALQRNYPDLNFEEFEESMDFLTVFTLIPTLISNEEGKRQPKNGQKQQAQNQ